MIEVVVDLGDRAYPVLIGAGVRHRLGEVLPAGVKRVAVVTQREVNVAVDPGVPFETFYVPPGENAKRLETIGSLCSDFANYGLTRTDCVVAVGGGVVTDLAGFAAAVYHRGIAVVHVSTTLLGQVDAAIGGKTGVNLPEGKNLIGAFWQPSAVLCDTEVLQQLPAREYKSGTGEMAKYTFFGAQVGVRTDDMLDISLDERIARCVDIKTRVVAADEREGGLRAILNYGHTLAHALETTGKYDLRHGEAVAIGIHFAALLAWHLGRIDEARVAEHLHTLETYGLPVSLPESSDLDALVDVMKRDKKATNGLTFVLDGPNGVEPVRVDEAQVATVLRELASK